MAKIVEQLRDNNPKAAKQNWLDAVRRLVVTSRPDLKEELEKILGNKSQAERENLLAGMSIGELAACYEALLAAIDATDRKTSGQYFTPDDAAQFMARQATTFPAGTWLDPCCGIGNLSWHLAGTQQNPDHFIAEQLTLIDKDPIALRTAIALIGAEYAAPAATDTIRQLAKRAANEDYLASPAPPESDYVILNPPYSRGDAPPAPPSYETAKLRELFALFVERTTKTARGFVAVTPAAYLHAPKYAALRKVLEENQPGGDIYVFDNVPDTLFRGYKFGSTNTSKTNFVRAAITVCDPDAHGWKTTPIIRWRANERTTMFQEAPSLLADRLVGPHGEWVKLHSALTPAWKKLVNASRTLADITVEGPTPYRLDVALTPRYYISAAFKPLKRRSKRTLHFALAADRDEAAAVLNSSIPYLWWRALDGGVNLPMRVLMSVPLPPVPAETMPLIRRLEKDEADHRVTKLNAGRHNENVKRPRRLVAALDSLLLPEAARHLETLYSNSLFH